MALNKQVQAFSEGLLKLNPLIFLVLGVFFGTVCIVELRHNNETMDQLRTAVYQADKSGVNVQGALDKLQSYVTAHMNTNLSDGAGSVYPPIQLEYTYARLAQAETAKSLSANSNLYTQAQQYCQSLDPTDFSGHNRVPCIEQYVSSHGASLPTIPSSEYEFDFVSPTWSPDLAGWSLLFTVASFAAALLLTLRRLVLKFTRA